MDKKDKVRKKKVKKFEQTDEEVLMEESISTFGMIGLALTFICLGAMVGYILYRLALNNGAIIIVDKFLL